MIKVTRIDHVGIAAESIAASLPFYSLMNLQVTQTEESPSQGLKMVFLPIGESQVEILESTDPSSAIGKFLAKRGEGIHHICLAVEDIDGAVKELIAAGVEMIDRTPRRSVSGYRVAFIHPRSANGVLVELLGD